MNPKKIFDSKNTNWAVFKGFINNNTQIKSRINSRQEIDYEIITLTTNIRTAMDKFIKKNVYY